MIRQLLSKWGMLTVELATALDADMAVINDDGTKNYVEAEPAAEVIVTVPSEAVNEEPVAVVQSTGEVVDIHSALFG